MANRPVGREKNVSGGGSGVHRRGSGLSGGPAGRGDFGGFSSRPNQGGSNRDSGFPEGNTPRRSGGGRSPKSLLGIMIVVIIIGVLVMKSGACSTGQTGSVSGLTGTADTQQSDIGSLFGSGYGENFGSTNYGTGASGWNAGYNNGSLDTTVNEAAREKYTRILGNGQDTVTLMVYMCGTDLESRSSMASRDIQEMANATIADNVNVILYTGGCRSWHINGISNKVNQIFQVKSGSLTRLEENMGSGAMTDPATLTTFVNYCTARFPANRYQLIFWDHGSGSNSGYGYDEKYPNAGGMTLAGINTALKNTGVKFDFIGFDACLMATVENALVCSQYADYLVASEETEPGTGWYYTPWVSALSNNTSIPTLEIGQKIADSFTQASSSACAGQNTTLSVVDLAELQATVPEKLAGFAQEASKMIQEDDYKQIAEARSGSREFAPTTRIDQIDLVHFAENTGTESGKELSKVLKSAVKYNIVSSGMTNAYGLSVYFPYKKVSGVDSMVSTYEAIGMDEDYTKCIQQFASLEVAGQVAAGGTGSAGQSLFGSLGQLLGGGSSSGDFGSLFGGSSAGGLENLFDGASSGGTGNLLEGGTSSGGLGSLFGSGGSLGSSYGNADMISSLLGSFMSSDFSGISGLNSGNTGFLGRTLDIEKASEYIAAHQFNPENLAWQETGTGEKVLSLPEEQWDYVRDLDLNMFYSDGDGLVDLGIDNVYDLDEDGNILAPADRTWVTIDGQVVAYYRIETVGDQSNYRITGRVPAELNGVAVNLILVFDSENPNGYVAGACYDYVDGETEMVAKNLTELNEGDTLDFVCDYYDFEGNFQSRYYLGDTMTITGSMEDLEITNTDVGDGLCLAAYCFTDIYDEQYWTEFLAIQ